MAKTAKATAEKVNGKKTPLSSVEDRKGGDAPETESKKQAQSVDLPEAIGNEAAGPPNTFEGSPRAGSLDILLDMSVPVAVSVGRAQIPVRRLLQLGPGSVLKLDKPIDEPADLFLKDSKFAAGDVVVVDGHFAVRIREIVGAEPQITNPQ